jgi:hypothetical protein
MAPGARSCDSPRLPFCTLPRLLRPRSASLLRAAQSPTALHRHLAWTLRISRLATPTSLSHCPPLAVQLPHILASLRQAIMPGLLAYPAWSPRIAEPLPTPCGAAASPQRPGALYPEQADTSTSAPHGPPLHFTGAVHTGLTLPGPTAPTRSRDPLLYGPRAPKPKAIVDVPGLHQAASNLRGTSVAPQPDAPRGCRRQQEPRRT